MLDAHYSSTLIIPLTTKLINDAAPLRIRIRASGRLKRDSDLLIAQLRAIDNQRLIAGPLTKLPGTLLRQIGEAIQEVLGVLPV